MESATLAAIDVGSNAIRLKIVEVKTDGTYRGGISTSGTCPSGARSFLDRVPK